MGNGSKLVLFIASITVIGVYAISIKEAQSKALRLAITNTESAQMKRTIEAGIVLGMSRLSQDSLRTEQQSFSQTLFSESTYPSELLLAIREDSTQATIEFTAVSYSLSVRCKAIVIRSDLIQRQGTRARKNQIHYGRWTMTRLYES